MEHKARIEQYLRDNSFQEALSLYQRHLPSLEDSKSTGEYKFHMSVAKGYFLSGDYQKTVAILESLAISDVTDKYEAKLLEFKARFLIDGQGRHTLKELEEITKGKEFDKFHVAQVKELEKFVQVRERSLSRSQLHLQYQQYEKLKELETQRGAFSFEGFPMFLVSKRWLEKWKAYVGCDDAHISRDHPGPMSNFEIIQHSYSLLQDPLSQKHYTNRQLYSSSQYQILTKFLWKFLHQMYGGIEVKRWNISMLERPTQTVTEVWLKRLEVYIWQESDRVHIVQISRKEDWKELQKKLIRIHGPGRIWKSLKGTNKPLSITNPRASFEQEDTSNVAVIFQRPSADGKYKLGDASPLKSPSVPKCANCGKTQSLSFCQCKTIRYCNMQCLVEHRPKHRKDCESKLQQEEQRIGIVKKFNLREDVKVSGRKGLVGLSNLGNTCYMNSGIQCLSHTRQITEYFMGGSFLDDLNMNNPLGSNGYLSCSYSKLMRDMWAGGDQNLSPWELKKAISKFSPQFSGFGQHDSQELISTLLDGLHEDVNKIKHKPIIGSEEQTSSQDNQTLSKISWDNYRARNLSFISSLVAGQYKSTLTCPKCKRISISFDPFMLISLPIPVGLEVSLYFIPREMESALRLDITIQPLATISDITQKIKTLLTISAENDLRMYQVNRDYEVKREFKSIESADLIHKSHYMIFCYEIPPESQGELYKVSFYYKDFTSYQPKSFPRFVRSKGKPSTQLIMSSIEKSVKSQKPGDGPDSIFTLEYKPGQVKVLLKQNFKLASYKQLKTPEQLIDLKSCLNLFTKEQKLDRQNQWYCGKCKLHVEANKTMQIYDTNKILVIGLKRFRINRKLKCFVKFPLNNLDMTDYVLGHKNKDDKLVYELYAVSNHFGTLGGGHYTAYCKNFINGRWYEFNDSRVSDISQNEVVSANAYVLFYRRSNQ